MTTNTTTIVAISGSLRQGSYNTNLLRVAVELAPSDCRIEIASLKDIPLYNGDDEAAHGIPVPVANLKEKIAAASGLLIATPEYNHSIPGVLKNAIDWLSRPSADVPRVFGGRRVGLIGATPGLGGTRLAQAAWLPVLRTLGTFPWWGKQLGVDKAGEAFDGDGRLVNPQVRERLTAYINGFVAFVRAG